MNLFMLLCTGPNGRYWAVVDSTQTWEKGRERVKITCQDMPNNSSEENIKCSFQLFVVLLPAEPLCLEIAIGAMTSSMKLRREGLDSERQCWEVRGRKGLCWFFTGLRGTVNGRWTITTQIIFYKIWKLEEVWHCNSVTEGRAWKFRGHLGVCKHCFKYKP